VHALKSFIERFLFACRWLLVPIYIILALSLLELLGQTALKALYVVKNFTALGDEGVMLSVLGLVDLTLTASLVVIVFVSGYTNFVSPVAMRDDDRPPHWITEIDFGELKLKLMASIVAISAIKLLEGFMDVANESDRELFWLLGIHLTFVVSAFLLALADRIGHRPQPGGGGDAKGV
jgi:uncharacterized protein (TIGR00645 family)